jgi:AcrR family transcriptional regulator
VNVEPPPGQHGPFPDWAQAGHPRVAAVPGEGLRERKKRITRQLISDTATTMFLERGFEEVRVAEVAAACNVSEKTVYNYFPTKESLVLDREEAMTAAVERALGPGGPAGSPVDAVVALISEEMSGLYDYRDPVRGEPLDLRLIRRFVDLFERTPSLRAAQRDMMERLAETAARAMATRAGVDPLDPEPQIAASAILGLYQVQFRAMERYSDGSCPADEVRDRVLAEVRRAARLIETGLWSFGMAVQGRNGRDQVRAAAEAANEARRQVMTAIKQAREAWRQVVSESHGERMTPKKPRGQARPPGPPPAPHDRPALPVKSPDDSDIGWGELPDRNHDDHLRDSRPPHWGE